MAPLVNSAAALLTDLSEDDLSQPAGMDARRRLPGLDQPRPHPVRRQHREETAGRCIRGRTRVVALTLAGAAGRDLDQGVEHPGVTTIENCRKGRDASQHAPAQQGLGNHVLLLRALQFRVLAARRLQDLGTTPLRCDCRPGVSSCTLWRLPKARKRNILQMD